MENHGLGTHNYKISMGWKFNWKYPTIYSAHLSKSANYLGYFWKKFSSHVHCPCCTLLHAMSSALNPMQWWLQMVKLSTKRWHLAKRPLKMFFCSLFLQKKRRKFQIDHREFKARFILDLRYGKGRTEVTIHGLKMYVI